MFKKNLSLGMAAAAVILLGVSVSACANKNSNADTEAQEQQPIEAATVEEEIPDFPAAQNAAEIAAVLDLLTPEEGLTRDSVVKETPSGLKFRIVKAGTGRRPGGSDIVTVNYEGKLTDGTKFDSSYDRGDPASFPLNRVIQGWTEGLQLMKEGGIYEFYIPSNLAYGEQGAPGAIPPNSDIVFKVELLKVGQ